MSDNYDLVVGAKRQVTIPPKLLKQLALKEGDYLRVTVAGQTVSLEPMVSVPRSLVSDALLQEMEARRGSKANDLTLKEFVGWRRTLKEQEGDPPVTPAMPAEQRRSAPMGVQEVDMEEESPARSMLRS
jgi:AbrB family looped-hinge helix DNA binding protein